MAVECLNPCEELCIEYRIPGSCVESDECIPGCQCPPGRLSISAQHYNCSTAAFSGLFEGEHGLFIVDIRKKSPDYALVGCVNGVAFFVDELLQ